MTRAILHSDAERENPRRQRQYRLEEPLQAIDSMPEPLTTVKCQKVRRARLSIRSVESLRVERAGSRDL